MRLVTTMLKKLDANAARQLAVITPIIGAPADGSRRSTPYDPGSAMPQSRNMRIVLTGAMYARQLMLSSFSSGLRSIACRTARRPRKAAPAKQMMAPKTWRLGSTLDARTTPPTTRTSVAYVATCSRWPAPTLRLDRGSRN